MSDCDQPKHSIKPSDNSEPKDDDPQSTPDPREPEPDIDVDVPTFQYLTEGFDPNQIKKR